MTRIAHTKALLITPSASRSCINRRVTFPEKLKSIFHRGLKTHSFLFSVPGSGERSEGDRSCYRYDQLKLILSPMSELLDQCSKCSVIDAERGTAPGNQAGAAALP